MVTAFFITSLSLAYTYSRQDGSSSVISGSVIETEYNAADVPPVSEEGAATTQESDIPAAPTSEQTQH